MLHNGELRREVEKLEKELERVDEEHQRCEGIVNRLNQKLYQAENRIRDLEEELRFAYESGEIRVPENMNTHHNMMDHKRYSREKSPIYKY